MTKNQGYRNFINDHLKKDALIYYQILSTNSLRKCMEINLENFYVDTGPKPGLTLLGALPCSDSDE